MSEATKIKFTTAKSRSKLLSGEVRYLGQLRHNRVLGPKMSATAYADYLGLKQSMAQKEIDTVGAFVFDELAKGNRVNLGWCMASLKMKGGFTSPTERYDPKKHTLEVILTPNRALAREAVAALKPVNIQEKGATR